MIELAIIFPCLAYVQDDFRETALVTAVNKGHFHVAEILVKNGADVNYRNKVRALIPITQVCIMCPDKAWYYGEPGIVVQLPSSPHCSHSITVH